MAKILKNNTASPVNIADVGQIVPASGQLTIQPQDYWLYAASSNVITFIGDSTLTVNDGTSDLSISDGVCLIKHIFPNPVGVAAGDDGTPIGHVGDRLKVTALIQEEKQSFNSSGGLVVGTTETTISIPAGTVKFSIQAASSAGAAVLTIADVLGGTGSELTSWEICPGNSWDETLNDSATLTIYIKSSKANTNVQVVTWA